MAARSRTRPPTRPRGAAAPAAPQPERRSGRPLLLALVLAAAAYAAYSTSFAGVFVFDDKYAILDNPHIKSLWPLTEAMSAPPENPVSGRPIASLTLAINYALAPDEVRDVMLPGAAGDTSGRTERFLRNVWGYHAVNLLLHVLAGLALLGVTRRTFLGAVLRPRFGEMATPLALIVASIWIVHPLTIDAVTYVCQRTEVLMGLFLLTTIYCAIRAGDEQGRARLAWSAGAIAASALGMGSKQTMVVAPLLVWLWDWTFTRAATRRWLLAGLAATWSVLALLVMHERWPTSVGIAIQGWTPWTYLLTQTGVVTHYLRLVFLPWPLVLDYDGWPMARRIADVWPHVALLSGLFLITAAGVVRRKPWAFAGAAVFLLLGPSSSLLPLPTEIAAERRMYLPLAAVTALAVSSVFAMGQRWVAARGGRRVAMAACAVLAAAVCVSLAALTHARNRDFWSDAGIWADAVAKRPDNPRARVSYGVALAAERRFAEAEPQLREAVRLRDASAPAHGSLGTLLCMTGRAEEGIPHLERALAIDQAYTDAFRNLGEAYASLGHRERAAKYFARAVEVSPDHPFLLSRLGWLLATAPEAAVRDAARAVDAGERAVRVTSRQDVMALDTLAAAYAEARRFTDAAATAREAMTLARQHGDRQTFDEIAGRLALYLSGRPYREPPG